MIGAVFVRWEAKVHPEPNSGCWLWTGAVNNRDYGQLKVDGRSTLAHRLAYEHFIGAIPVGLVIDHKCSTSICVNPDHLQLVTPSVNSKLTWARGRGFDVGSLSRAKTHCPSGHEYTPDNTYVSSGRRHCAVCSYAKVKAYRARRRSELKRQS